MKKVVLACVALGAVLASCRRPHPSPLDAIGRDYVVLALALGSRDPVYVESFHGPDGWRLEAQNRFPTTASIGFEASRLLNRLDALQPETERRRNLRRQLASLRDRVAWLRGAPMSFDAQTEAFYGRPARSWSEAELASRLEGLDRLLEGDGSLLSRYGNHQQRFIVPRDELEPVFERALEECRRRTAEHIELPVGERYRLELVYGKPWAAYSWYEGGHESLIELNAGFGLTIDAMIDLACHEAYPGHHTMQVLLESRGDEYTVMTRYGPLTALSEGLAEIGVELVFPPEERRRFEREVLFPLAGISTDDFEIYDAVRTESRKLRAAHIEIARRYLDSDLSRGEAADWLRKYALVGDPEPALRFMQIYRSYAASYEVGERLVREYLESRPGHEWRAFEDMLTEETSWQLR